MPCRRLRLLAEPVSVSRFPATADVPAWALAAPFASVTRTPDELSVICSARVVPRGVPVVGPFRALGLEGPVAFEETGVLAALVAPLASVGVSVLAFATHDTDWVLVRHEELERAVDALRAAGVETVRPVGRVEAVHVAAAEGLPMREVAPAALVTDLGLEGDRYAKAGSRAQVTVAFTEELAAAARELGLAIAPGATRRNVTVAGLGGAPPVGARMRVGAALLEVTGPAEPCRLMDEVIAPGACAALRHRGGVRARVLEGGTLQPGEPVSVASS